MDYREFKYEQRKRREELTRLFGKYSLQQRTAYNLGSRSTVTSGKPRLAADHGN